MERTAFIWKVSQVMQPELRGLEEEDKLVIRVKLTRNVIGPFPRPSDPVCKHVLLIDKRDIKVSFSHIKKQLLLQSKEDMKEYEDAILEAMKDINFPLERRAETVEEIFKLVQEEAVVFSEISIVAHGAYTSHFDGPFYKGVIAIMLRPVKMKLTEKSDSCSICLNNLLSEQHDIDKHRAYDLSRLYCQHIFHKDCIRSWLFKNRTCPLCRFKIPHDDDYDDSAIALRLGNDPAYHSIIQYPPYNENDDF